MKVQFKKIECALRICSEIIVQRSNSLLSVSIHNLQLVSDVSGARNNELSNGSPLVRASRARVKGCRADHSSRKSNARFLCVNQAADCDRSGNKLYQQRSLKNTAG